MLRILLVDDDTEDQYMFCEAVNTLKLMIYCKSVFNGKEALTHLEHVPNYDLIFLDLNMPVMDGIQCLETLKVSEKNKGIKVVIFTTSLNPDHKTRCEELGIKTYWNKPNAFAELCNGLYDIIKN